MEEKKVVFVTGGSRGIGKEVALKYAQNGFNIVTNYVSDKTDVEKLKKEFEENNIEALVLKADYYTYYHQKALLINWESLAINPQEYTYLMS